MWKPSGEFNGKASPTGISWFLEEYRGNKMVSHDGGDTGFLTGLTMLPEKKTAVMWMTHGDWLPNTAAITHAALDVALHLEPKSIEDKRSIAQTMFATYSDRGIDAAIKQYGTLKNFRPDAYNFDVDQLNKLGRYLLRNVHATDAIHILQLNLTAYPSSANTFDALGEAYEKAGNQALAITNYQKAQQLDPKQNAPRKSVEAPEEVVMLRLKL